MYSSFQVMFLYSKFRQTKHFWRARVRSTWRLAQVLAIALLGQTFCLCQDRDCDSILQQGLRNTYKNLRSGDFRNAFQNEYCNKTSGEHGSESRNSLLGMSGDDFLQIGINNNDTATSRQENCGKGGSSMSDQKYENAMASVADPNIVEAWRQCVTQPYGVRIYGDLNGNDIVSRQGWTCLRRVHSIKDLERLNTWLGSNLQILTDARVAIRWNPPALNPPSGRNGDSILHNAQILHP